MRSRQKSDGDDLMTVARNRLGPISAGNDRIRRNVTQIGQFLLSLHRNRQNKEKIAQQN